jgi:anti-anti-sigma regulatory factor
VVPRKDPAERPRPAPTAGASPSTEALAALELPLEAARARAVELVESSRRALLAARANRTTAQGRRAVRSDELVGTVVALMAGAEARMRAEPEVTGDWRVLLAPPEVDGADAIALVRAAFSEPGDVLIDLRSTTLLTAAGAQALYDIHRHAELTGHLAALLGPADIVRTVLRVTGLDDIIPVLPDPDALGFDGPALDDLPPG